VSDRAKRWRRCSTALPGGLGCRIILQAVTSYWASMRRLLACLLLFTSGCVHYVYSQTTQNLAAAKTADCDFEIFTMAPGRAYLELGVLDIGGDATAAPHSVAKFKAMVRKSVCQAGGDAVLAQVNWIGGYMHGTVIQYK
jgi:hypothetical protein